MVHIDSISDHLLAPTKLANLFLKYENLHDNVSTNPIADLHRKYAKNLDPSPRENFPSEYLLLTLHKPAIVEDPETMKNSPHYLKK
jgi:UDP-N-acetylglucosamine 2-epimerase